MLLRWWLVAVPLLVIVVIAQMNKVALSLAISNKKFLEDLDLVGRPAVIGSLMSAFLLTYASFTFFWGWFIKRFGPRITSIVGIMIWSLSLVLTGIARSAGFMIFAKLVHGAGEAFTFPVCGAFVANWFPSRERGRASSFFVNGMALGPVLCGAIVVALMSAGAWRIAFLGLAVLSFIIPRRW